MNTLRMFTLILMLIAVSGCPSQDQQASSDNQGSDSVSEKEQQELEEFLARIETPEGKRAEFLRLREKFLAPPDKSSITPASNDKNFRLGHNLKEESIRLTATHKQTGEHWEIECWHSHPHVKHKYVLETAEESPGGYLLKVVNESTQLLITIRARWTNGRYLEIQRELLQRSDSDESGFHSYQYEFRLFGPQLPYCIDSADHFYGVRDSNFRRRPRKDPPDIASFPIWFPAAAVYDDYGGALLLSPSLELTEENYELAWQATVSGEDELEEALIRIKRRKYTGVYASNVVYQLEMGEGETDNAGIVFEPFSFKADSVAPEYPHTQTIKACSQLSQASSVYLTSPVKADSLPEGNLICLDDYVAFEEGSVHVDWDSQSSQRWSSQFSEDDDFVSALGIWDVCAVIEEDYTDLTGLIKERGIVVLRELDPVRIVSDKNMAKELSLPEVLRDTRDLIEGNSNSEQADGFLLRSRSIPVPEPTEIFDYYSHNEIVKLWAYDYVKRKQPDAIFISEGHPNFLSLALADEFLIDTFHPTNSTISEPARRYGNALLHETFERNMRLETQYMQLSECVLLASPESPGYLLRPHLADFAGFDSFASHSRELKEASSDGWQVVAGIPEKNDYMPFGGPAASYKGLVAIVPPLAKGEVVYWICFHGVNGSVSVDHTNTLQIEYTGLEVRGEGADTAGSFTATLPTGYWEAEHPSPDSVRNGDVVLLKRKFLQAPAVPGADRT